MRRHLALVALIAAFALAAPVGGSGVAGAAVEAPKPPQTPIGFSKLIVRLEGHDDIGVVGADHQVRLLERLRAKGLHAVGAEDLVFGKDESRKAEMILGGTVKELDCVDATRLLSCRIGVEWQLFDVARDGVVYSVLSRAAVLDVPASKKESYGSRLLAAALDRLVERKGFLAALERRGEASSSADPTFPQATLGRCAPGRKVAESAEDLLRTTAIVKAGGAFGSGFVVSPEGLVLTAAHVARHGSLVVRLREGTEHEAVVVRAAPGADVALLRTSKPLNGHACAPLRVDPPAIGAEVYAAGAPASLELAFSLTRGIVSGAPTIDGQRRIQTDTPVNPGNSGGPLADANGRVVGLVSFKLSGGRIEGVGFAVPTADALTALGLSLGDGTEPRLFTEVGKTVEAPPPERVEDTPDPRPSLDPEGDARRAEEEARLEAEARRRAEQRAREDARDRLTPTYVPVLRWGGVALATVGLVTMLTTTTSYDETTTRPEFESLRWKNTLGWAGLGLGVGAFVTSFVLQPPLPATVPVTANSRLRVGLGAVAWEGTF